MFVVGFIYGQVSLLIWSYWMGLNHDPTFPSFWDIVLAGVLMASGAVIIERMASKVRRDGHN